MLLYTARRLWSEIPPDDWKGKAGVYADGKILERRSLRKCRSFRAFGFGGMFTWGCVRPANLPQAIKCHRYAI